MEANYVWRIAEEAEAPGFAVAFTDDWPPESDLVFSVYPPGSDHHLRHLWDVLGGPAAPGRVDVSAQLPGVADVSQVQPDFVRLLAGVADADVERVALAWHATRQPDESWGVFDEDQQQLVSWVRTLIAFARRAVRERKPVLSRLWVP